MGTVRMSYAECFSDVMVCLFKYYDLYYSGSLCLIISIMLSLYLLLGSLQICMKFSKETYRYDLSLCVGLYILRGD